MPERSTVRRATPGQWTATRPRYGFGPPEQRTFPAHARAIAWATRSTPDGGGALVDWSPAWRYDPQEVTCGNPRQP